MRFVYKVTISLFLTLAIAFVVGFFVSGALRTFILSITDPQFTFDFPLDNRPDWAGPNQGELVSFPSGLQENLNEATPRNSKKLVLVTFVDSDCPASRMAADQIHSVNYGARNLGITVIGLSLHSEFRTEQPEQTASNLALHEQPFSWNRNEFPLPNSLALMVIPSQALFTTDGKVVKTFPGTHKDPEVRLQMSREIIKQIKLLSDDNY